MALDGKSLEHISSRNIDVKDSASEGSEGSEEHSLEIYVILENT